MRYPHVRANQSFRVTNPTFGTGIAQNIIAAYDSTKPILAIYNSDGANGKSIYMDYIKLINSVAGASTTAAHLGMVLDTADRYVSGGTRLTVTPGAFKANSALSDTAIARIDFGALVAASVAGRQVARDAIKTQAAPCWIVGDECYIKFDTFDFSPALTSGAATAIFGVPSGPVIIAPGHILLVYIWNITNSVTAPSWEIEMAWWEQQDRG